MRLSVSKKLGIYFIALIALATFLVSYYSYSKTKEALMKRTFDQLTSVRVEKKNRIENFFGQRQKEVSNLINTEDLQAIF